MNEECYAKNASTIIKDGQTMPHVPWNQTGFPGGA